MTFSRVVERTRCELDHLFVRYQARGYSRQQCLELLSDVERMARLEANASEQFRIGRLINAFRYRLHCQTDVA